LKEYERSDLRRFENEMEGVHRRLEQSERQFKASAHTREMPALSASLMSKLESFRAETEKIKHNAQSFNQK
jgi:hypothetical protein